jgi:hypothetical protein
MAITYEPIATTTLTTASASVTFSSISGSYTDLIIIASVKASTGTPDANFTVNNDTGSNYSRTGLYGDGSTAGSFRNSNVANAAFATINSTNFTPVKIQLQNYSNTTTNKTFLYSGGLDYPAATVFLYRSTSAITRVDFSISSGNYASGSTFTLYGIKAA